MTVIVLTDEETEIILDRRKKIKEQENRELLERHLVKTTAEYIDWLFKHERGSTSSTFFNEFGYESDAYQASYVFRQVEIIRKAITTALRLEVLNG
jgi:hypothetical protein